MSQITRKNHFLPQWYLRRWSDDGKTVRLFRLLVSHEDVPEWTSQGISSAGSRHDLYTGFEGGAEVDRFEDWLTREFEEPAVEAVRVVVDGGDLTEERQRRLAMFFALQDLRTPSAFVEFLRRWEPSLQDLLDETLRKSVADLTRAVETGVPPERPSPPPQDFAQPIVIEKHVPDDPSEQPHIKVEVTLGRGLWLSSIQNLLTGVASHLESHCWSVAEPYGDAEWFTSDHPALKLNYYAEGNYDFGGGWGRWDGVDASALSKALALHEGRPRDAWEVHDASAGDIRDPSVPCGTSAPSNCRET